jgi:SAM-dependent methyltransferase
VLPLSLYLLSFVICFHDRRWYVRPVFLSGFMLSMVGAVLTAIYQQHLSAVAQIAIFCTMLFLCCMVCHGEVYRLRPQPHYLTGYYLMIALGGAAGGVFVAIIAPLIFRTYLELNLGMMACCLFVLLADKTPALRRGRRRWVYVSLIILVGVLVALVPTSPFYTGWTVLTRHRNFYGVATVWERSAGDPLRHCRLLEHGTTVHGIQLVDPAVRRAPTAYYGVKSGVGVALLQLLQGGESRRIGVVGLGVGTIAAYGRPGDTVRFYEINPVIERLARSLFGYLADSLAKVDVVMGDARLSLEGEPPQEFDILVLDAFSSDSVPVHLLTKEAFDLYLRHLRPDGVIAVHASTRHVDLELVAFTLADHFKLQAALIEDAGEDSEGTLASSWVLLSRNEALMNSNAIRAAAGASQANYPRTDLWTDDRANLLKILR